MSPKPEASPNQETQSAIHAFVGKPLLSILSTLSPAQKVTIFTLGTVFAAIPLILLGHNRGPAYEFVIRGESDGKELSRAIREFQRQDIRYRVGDDGQSVSVPQKDVARALQFLKRSNLKIQGNKPEDFCSSPGSSPFAPGFRRTREEKLLEDDLARTIMMIDAVEFARVHISRGKRGLYSKDDRPAKASIFLELMRGRRLEANQVESIVDLTANAVVGLRPEDITICDNLGSRYGSTDISGEQVIPALPDQSEVLRMTESLLIRKVNTTLTRLFGEDGYTTAISVSLVRAPVQFPMKSGPLRFLRPAELAPASLSHLPEVGRSPDEFDTESPRSSSQPTSWRNPGIRRGTLKQMVPDSTFATVQILEVSSGVSLTANPFTRGRAFIGATCQHLSHDVGLPIESTGFRIARLALSVLVNSIKLPGRTMEPGLRRTLEHHLKSSIGFCRFRGDSFVVMTVPFASCVAISRFSEITAKVWGWVNQNFTLFWGLQLAVLTLILVMVVKRSNQITEIPATMDPVTLAALRKRTRDANRDRRRPGVVARLERAIYRMDEASLKGRLAQVDAETIGHSLRLLPEARRRKVLLLLSESIHDQVVQLMASPVPLRKMEESLAGLTNILMGED